MKKSENHKFNHEATIKSTMNS